MTRAAGPQRRAATMMVLAAISVAAWAAITPGTAWAGKGPRVPLDTCFGVDHFPDDPVGDAPSKIVLGAVFGPDVTGARWTVSLDGPSGLVSGETIVDADGRGMLDVGIFSYGSYTVASSMVGTQPVDLTGVGDGGTIAVDGSESDCELTVVVVESTTTTTVETTTTTFETTTTAPSTTVTTPETTTIQIATPVTTAPATDAGAAGSGAPWWSWPAVLGGLAVAGVGLWMALAGGRDCDPLLVAWPHTRSVLEGVREGLEQARAALAERTKRVAEITGRLASLEKSADSWVTEHGTRYHLIEGGKVTASGLEEITASTRRELETAKTHAADARRSVESWESRLIEAKTAEESARAAYTECIGDAVGDAADDLPEPPAPSGTAVAPPPTTSVTTPPTPGGGCTEGAAEVVPAGKADQVWVIRDFSVIVEVQEASKRPVAAARQMALDLSKLAGNLGVAGSLLGGFGSGRSVSGAVDDLATGSYVKSALGFARGGAEGYVAGRDPNIGTDTFPISVPTSPAEAGTEVLEATARLGALVADRAAAWMEKNQLYKIRLTYFRQQITATPYEVRRCRNGVWVCAERIYQYDVGRLTRLAGPEVSDIVIRDDLARDRFDREVERIASYARSALAESVRNRARFEQDHQPGPCR